MAHESKHERLIAKKDHKREEVRKEERHEGRKGKRK